MITVSDEANTVFGNQTDRGVQRHPGDAKCITEILGGTKIRKLGGAKLAFLF